MVKKFIIKLFVSSIIIMLPIIAYFIYYRPQDYFNFFPVIPIFFFALTSISYSLFYKAIKKKSTQISTTLMASSAIKLFASIIILLIGFFIEKNHLIQFAVSMAIFYFFYTYIEIKEILSFKN